MTSATLQSRLLDKRVHALAIIHLTRRRDLIVREPGEDLGFDLTLQIVRDEKPGLRQFGVALQGTWSCVSRDRANDILLPALRQLQRQGPFPFPVCVLLFTMEDTQAWYAWASEPTATENGKVRLESRSRPDCRPLDGDALDEIVRRVDAWYDAFYANLVTSGAGPVSKPRRRP